MFSKQGQGKNKQMFVDNTWLCLDKYVLLPNAEYLLDICSIVTPGEPHFLHISIIFSLIKYFS